MTPSPLLNTRKELLSLPKNYTIVDLETTGLFWKTDFIIEAAAIKIRNNKPLKKFSTLIHSPVPLTERVISLTGIHPQMLQNAPDFQTIADDLWNFIGEDIVVGHSIPFDISFLCHHFFTLDNRTFSNSFVDTFPLSKKLFPELVHHRLMDISAYYKIPTDNAHRALADCTMNYHVFECMKKTVIKTYGSFEAFLSIWNQPQEKLCSASIVPSTTAFSKEHFLYGKFCVITGALNQFSRKEAMQQIADSGGINMDKLNTSTNLLILGNNNYCNLISGMSKKHKKALRLIDEGYPIQILSEEEFCQLIITNASNPT